MGDLSTTKVDGQPQALPAPKAPSRALLAVAVLVPVLLIVTVLWMTGVWAAIGSALYAWGVGFSVIWPQIVLWGGAILGIIALIVIFAVEEIREVVLSIVMCLAMLWFVLWLIWQATFGLWQVGHAKLTHKPPVAEQKK